MVIFLNNPSRPTNLRHKHFLAVINDLLSDHNDRELKRELDKAAPVIALLITETKEGDVVAGVTNEPVEEIVRGTI